MKKLISFTRAAFYASELKNFQDFKKNRRLSKSLDFHFPFHQTLPLLHGWHSNLVTLIGKSLTSHVIRLTRILAKILTSVPYNCWPLLLRMSVIDNQ